MNGKKLSTGLIVAIVLAVIILIGVFAVIGQYNGLVSAEESVNQKYSDIQTQLQRRNDLIPNLVNTVKGYASHEEKILTAVTDAHAKMLQAGNAQEAAQADGELTQALGRLLALTEAYPELKANENFLSLQDQLEGTENRIAVARKDYNEIVQPYNTKIRSFPTNIFAGMFGFEKKAMFEASDAAQNTPSVDFK